MYGHPLKIRREQANSNLRNNCFINKICSEWNTCRLPEGIVTAKTPELAKARLDRFWEDNPKRFEY